MDFSKGRHIGEGYVLSFNWEIAIIKDISQFRADIETKNGIKGIINYNDIIWTKKEFDELLL